MVYKVSVVAHDLPYSPDMDAEIEFYVDPKDFEESKKHNRFMKLKLIDDNHSSRLNLANLLDHGMNGAPRGALQLSQNSYKELLEYITNVF